MSQRSKINASSGSSSRFAAVGSERKRAREIQRKADENSNVWEIERKSCKKWPAIFRPVCVQVLPEIVNPANTFLIRERFFGKYS